MPTDKSKNMQNYEYKKANYKQISLRIRKDDYVLKLLEKYRAFNPDESITTIIINALDDYLNRKLFRLEKHKNTR